MATPTGAGELGLRVEIYRPDAGDYSNGGISAHKQELTIIAVARLRAVGARAVREVEPLPADCRTDRVSEDAPAAVLVARELSSGPHFHVEPAWDPAEGDVGWMAGGTLVSGDGRLAELTGGQAALKLHDRAESSAMHRLLSDL